MLGGTYGMLTCFLVNKWMGSLNCWGDKFHLVHAFNKGVKLLAHHHGIHESTHGMERTKVSQEKQTGWI